MKLGVLVGLAVATVIGAGQVVAVPAATAGAGGVSEKAASKYDSGLEVYTGVVRRDQLPEFAAVGLDREDVAVGESTSADGVQVEVVMSGRTAEVLRRKGLELSIKQVKGKNASDAARAQGLAGHTGFRSYSEPGGIADELRAVAEEHPDLATLVRVGTSVNGQPILAVRVTSGSSQTGAEAGLSKATKPAVLYNGAQHAREWITPEMVRRLMHHMIHGYGTDPTVTRLVDTRELWFLPVSNPDGYDYTFTPGGRLWRKNLRDNNNDGAITAGDGVDPNRNFPTKWGYDNEGSSPDPSGETYRGPAPASEPETRALDNLVAKVGFTFEINYHSAAELLLYGTGWQVSTPSPDDNVFVTLAGTDDNSAVPGYDPDLSAELYTTNGETTEHMAATHGTLGFTPEMSTCQTASDKYDDDQWLAEDCASVFNFPDDERLISEEFQKNIPFALSVADSAADPANPVSSVGRTAPDLVLDPFPVSYGSTQPVAVVAKRELQQLRLNYSVNGRKTEHRVVQRWKGGERYGEFGNVYYAEYRGVVKGTAAGDSVKVWFSAKKPDGTVVTTDSFTYQVASDIGGKVLILAAEDVTGASPVQGLSSAKYAASYTAALAKAGYSSDVYDVDAMGRRAPHPLGVLSHYKAVVWESGDDVITRAVGQPGGTAAKLALDIEIAVRDYLNEGGKLLYTGKYAGFADGADGVYYYNPNVPDQAECTVRDYPCLPLFNDFLQYYLGTYQYISNGGSDENGDPYPVAGVAGGFTGFGGRLNGGDGADNQDHTASFLTTSSFLPPSQFPQFASSAPIKWTRPGGSPYDPKTGAWYAYSQRSDKSYKRLTRTIDLTGATSASLGFQMSADTELDWDYAFVEAHTVGQDDWTTLPDANGHTDTGTGDSCPEGWVDALHPFLAHYMDDGCNPTGTTGTWNAFTGNSNGWTPMSFDLSGYAGKQVEVSISYASDWATQGLGVFIDDTAVTVDGTPAATTSFEADLGGWAVAGPPPGTDSNANDWTRSQSAFEEGAGVVTDDTVYVGFGGEGLRSQGQRTALVGRSLKHLFS